MIRDMIIWPMHAVYEWPLIFKAKVNMGSTGLAHAVSALPLTTEKKSLDLRPMCAELS